MDRNRLKNQIIIAVGMLLTAMSAFLAGCSSAAVPSPTKVVLNLYEITMYVNDTRILIAETDVKGAEIVWSSDDEDVVTVSGGVVTAVGLGEATVKAKSGNVRALCEVSVTERPAPPSDDTQNKGPVLIDMVVTPPAKLDYYVGDTLDLDGLFVTARYSDGQSKTLTVGDFMMSEPNMTAPGTKQVMLSLDGVSAGFSITVSARPEDRPELVGLSVTPPKKTEYYVDEAFDTAGIAVKARYGDGSDVTLTASKYKISSPDMTTAGTKKITVTYEGVSETFNITVRERPATPPVLTGITVSPPVKLVYYVGDAFDTTGMTVKANYDKGDDVTLTANDYRVSTPDMSSSGTKRITVTYDGHSRYFDITVNIRPVTSVAIEKKTNSEVRANPGVWCYHADGNAGDVYTFTHAPARYDDGRLSATFANVKFGSGQFFYYRYQPAFEMGAEYIVRFTVMLGANATIRYGAPALKGDGSADNSVFQTVSVQKNVPLELEFEGVVTDKEPFSIRFGGNLTVNESFEFTVSNISFAQKGVYTLEKLNMAGGANKSGEWFYWADGTYTLSADPEYNNGIVTIGFNRVTSGSTYQLRIHPDGAADGKRYEATYTVTLSAAGKVRTSGGTTSGYNERTLAAGETVTVTYFFIAQTSASSSSPKPFCIQLIPSSANTPIMMTVSAVSFAERGYLKDVYSDLFKVGAAIEPGTVTAFPETVKHYNSFTPENSMKWKNIEPTECAFTYTNADRIVSYAKSVGADVRGHTFVWYKSNPDWLTGKATDKATALTYIEDHVEAMMRHFGSDIDVWDVANECIKNSPTAAQVSSDNYWRTGTEVTKESSGGVDWYGLCGTDFIKTAFRKAGEVRTSLGLTSDDMKLYYNDYNLIYPEKRNAAVKLVQMLKSEGLPIDGIGMQMHYRLSGYLADKTGWLKNFEDSLIAFTSLGIDVQITELDIRVYDSDNDPEIYNGELSPEKEEQQAELFAKIFELCRKYSVPRSEGAGRVTSLTTWGVADGSNGAWTTSAHREYPLIFAGENKPKKAYYDIIDF